MNIIDLGKQNGIVNQYIAEMRHAEIQKDSWRFRKNLERLGWCFGYEISKKLQYEDFVVETPLGEKEVPMLSEQVVLGTVLRAGLPLHQGLLDIFDHAGNAFISAYRKYHKDYSFEIFNGYVTCPPLDDKVLILADPMLATGASMEVAYNSLLEYGKPKHTHIVVVVASTEGVELIQKKLGKMPVTLWYAAMDEELSAKGYIIPGLGDAGDLAFGEKQ
ncbi:MAG: uracil phosphoribosyltransferase [Bacteroidales bacterium]|nr:uracil phosphoribosyltransferase [Bacteroidales bacterium]